MSQFNVNPYRHDPYKNFRFRIQWDGKTIAGVSKISALKKYNSPVTHREGSDPAHPRVSPGNWAFEPIMLERGVTHDTAFEDWANLSHRMDGEMSLKNFRKDIRIDLLNEQGVIAKSFIVLRCWVSEYQVLPELDANGHAIAIEKLKLENEGWMRDTGVSEPAET